MSEKNKKCRQAVKEFVESNDLYGVPVGLGFKD